MSRCDCSPSHHVQAASGHHRKQPEPCRCCSLHHAVCGAASPLPAVVLPRLICCQIHVCWSMPHFRWTWQHLHACSGSIRGFFGSSRQDWDSLLHEEGGADQAWLLLCLSIVALTGLQRFPGALNVSMRCQPCARHGLPHEAFGAGVGCLGDLGGVHLSSISPF